MNTISLAYRAHLRIVTAMTRYTVSQMSEVSLVSFLQATRERLVESLFKVVVCIKNPLSILSQSLSSLD